MQRGCGNGSCRLWGECGKGAGCALKANFSAEKQASCLHSIHFHVCFRLYPNYARACRSATKRSKARARSAGTQFFIHTCNNLLQYPSFKKREFNPKKMEACPKKRESSSQRSESSPSRREPPPNRRESSWASPCPAACASSWSRTCRASQSQGPAAPRFAGARRSRSSSPGRHSHPQHQAVKKQRQRRGAAVHFVGLQYYLSMCIMKPGPSGS